MSMIVRDEHVKGHPGFKMLYGKLKFLYAYPGLFQLIRKLTSGCSDCLLFKSLLTCIYQNAITYYVLILLT